MRLFYAALCTLGILLAEGLCVCVSGGSISQDWLKMYLRSQGYPYKRLYFAVYITHAKHP